MTTWTDESTWQTDAHEIGHIFAARHSFELGQGQTGGIMDYGDGLLNGTYMFCHFFLKRREAKKNQFCERKKNKGYSEFPKLTLVRRVGKLFFSKIALFQDKQCFQSCSQKLSPARVHIFLFKNNFSKIIRIIVTRRFQKFLCVLSAKLFS